MFEQAQHQQRPPVVVVTTPAVADLLATTFRVHGLDAMATVASAIPSLDWLEGFAVTVPAADEQRARALASELGHQPYEPPPP